MRVSSLLTLATALVTVSGQYLNQTGPFKLQIVSTDAKYDGQYLAACHEGAAIEALCPTTNASISSPFYYNYSDTSSFVSKSGYLTYLLVGGNFQVFEPLSLSYNPGSNVAVPLLQPSASGQLIAFDSDDLLYIPGGIDDTKDPIDPQTPSENLYRWSICQTYVGYAYTTLAWTLGEADPENPTCCPISVKKVPQ
jgi:hypothetical protein